MTYTPKPRRKNVLSKNIEEPFMSDTDLKAQNTKVIKLKKSMVEDSVFTTTGRQVINALPPSIAGDNELVNGAIEMFAGISPKTEIEAMLAAQMVACHNLAMEAAKRSAHPELSYPQLNDLTSQANKLMKTFALQTEALSKLRGKSKTVTVKHVTVAEGGQAVIGDVHHGGTNGKK